MIKTHSSESFRLFVKNGTSEGTFSCDDGKRWMKARREEGHR